MDETLERVVDNQSNQNVGNSNMICTYLKFVSFPSIIDQVILSKL